MDKNSAIIIVFLMAVVGMLLRPIVVAWSRRLSVGAANDLLASEVDELRLRVAELEAERGHVAELAERVDFAERLLAQRNDAASIPLHRTPV
jgi:hypothetical protein